LQVALQYAEARTHGGVVWVAVGVLTDRHEMAAGSPPAVSMNMRCRVATYLNSRQSRLATLMSARP